MSSIASRCFQTQRAERQCEVVDDDEQSRDVDILLVHPVSYGVAAKIHIRAWLQQYDLSSLDGRFGHESVSAVVVNNIGRLRKGVQYHKSCIVSGHVVFVADISQSHYQVFVHY